MNGKLKKKSYYVDNILQGDYYEYDDKGNIIKYLHV